jgi:dephospho-CoA kinase
VAVSGEPVAIVAHDRQWTERAAVLIATLYRVLGPTALRIDHVGSTAIPGMDAKDVLDIQVSVTDLDQAQEQFDPSLRGLGFAGLGCARDHVPAGRDDDPAVWVKRFWRRRKHTGDDVNLHVRVAGSPNERLALLFRDWMRAHPQAVTAYSAIKRSLAAAVPDLDTYTDVKDPIVDLVIVAAEEWATDTRWSASTRPAGRRP